MIDITMTATLRPVLISQTLTSFCQNIFEDRNNYRLVINIDPIGEKAKVSEILQICKSYFKDVVYNVPSVPNFAEAVMWCWKMSDSDFVFHLEDDWLCTRKIDINDMIRILKCDGRVACLRLSKYDLPRTTVIKLLGKHYTYTNNNYFVTSSNTQFGLNPVLIRKKFVKTAVQVMTPYSNPEKQFRPSKNEKMNKLINGWTYGLYGAPGSKALVVDNGARWKQKAGFKKQDGSFLVWEKCR